MKVLVTGSSSGIGKATAEKFLAMGHEVYGIDLRDPVISNSNYFHFKQDIRDPLPALPEMEVLVLNAGTIEECEAIEVNLHATIKMAEALSQSSVLRSVLIVASASARNGAEFPLYSASKGGLISYMKNLSLRLAKRGITCNSISPGGVITPMNEHILKNPALYEACKKETLLDRWADPEEISEWIYFLTVVNKSMTGEDLLIDNGEMLKSNFIW
ncbi:MAG: SDR family oxidoreductase [Bacilli bacterium]|nr:SDR family oxidoreductase [Bacilli bacterium]